MGARRPPRTQSLREQQRAVRVPDGVTGRSRGHVRRQRAVQRLLPAVLRRGGGQAPSGFSTGRTRRRVARRGRTSKAMPRSASRRRSRARRSPWTELRGRPAPGRGEDPGRDPRRCPGARHRPGQRRTATADPGATSSSASTSGHIPRSRAPVTISASGCRRRWRPPSRAALSPSRRCGARTAQLSIPAGTQNGARLRLRGLGMPHLKGGRRRRPARHRRRPLPQPTARAAARVGAVRGTAGRLTRLENRERVLAVLRRIVQTSPSQVDAMTSTVEHACAGMARGASRTRTGRLSSAQERGPGPRSGSAGRRSGAPGTGGPCWRSRSDPARSTSACEHERGS